MSNIHGTMVSSQLVQVGKKITWKKYFLISIVWLEWVNGVGARIANSEDNSVFMS